MNPVTARTGSFLLIWEGHINDIEAIAARIRSARKSAGLTQEDLAHLAETSERTIRAIETATGNPSLRAVTAAARVLGLRVEAH